MKSHMKIPNDQQNERQTFGPKNILSPYKQKLKMAGNVVVLNLSGKKTFYHLLFIIFKIYIYYIIKNIYYRISYYMIYFNSAQTPCPQITI